MNIGHAHGQFAADYDALTRAYQCYAAEVLFGLAFEYVRPGERLLDLGIGTGLSSAPFGAAGLTTFGLDASAEMLAQCQAKGFVAGLAQADLGGPAWPVASHSFDHVLACGLLHFIEDLEPVFSAVGRVARPGGVFAFTTKAPPPGSAPVTRHASGDIPVFLHRRDLVSGLAAQHGFALLKLMAFFVGDDQAPQPDVFHAWVWRVGG